ncbi:MAG TPA: hypothetical protein VK589_20200 [Chryseolinea sp.]|nr:hypothetical protein [Chryseolinea sp.]
MPIQVRSMVPDPLKKLYRNLQSTALNYRERKILDQRLSRGWRDVIRNITLCTIPNSIEGGYALFKILVVLGIKPRQFNPWITYDFIFNWQDLTFDRYDTLEYLQASYNYTGLQLGRTLNMKCTDISKRKMESLNLEVFGYPLGINPTSYTGKACAKADKNNAHDGMIVDCPIRPEQLDESKVYSIVVNNVDGDFVIDFRVPFIGGITDFFYEKRRNVVTRFSNTNDVTFIRKTNDFFNPEEIQSLTDFCKRLGLDYGELDVLRDKDTGRIYVVDVAKTPAGPPNALSRPDARLAATYMAEAFAINILKIHSAK